MNDIPNPVLEAVRDRMMSGEDPETIVNDMFDLQIIKMPAERVSRAEQFLNIDHARLEDEITHERRMADQGIVTERQKYANDHMKAQLNKII
ncbi:MAG: hypothetical protein WCL07_00460 [bacterium]